MAAFQNVNNPATANQQRPTTGPHGENKRLPRTHLQQGIYIKAFPQKLRDVCGRRVAVKLYKPGVMDD